MGMLILLTVLLFAEPSSATSPTTLPARTGRFEVVFTERSPIASMKESNRRFKWEIPIREIDLPKETFQVYVPPDYEPGKQFGLLVWCSPMNSGWMASKDWVDVLDKHKLIWVGADRAGNERHVGDRTRLAVEAAYNMMRQYDIDPTRVYVGGMSGGGRSASMAATAYGDLFAGGFYMCGVNYFRDVKTLNMQKKDEYWPGSFPRPPSKILQKIKTDSRFVLLTGENDMNKLSTKAVYQNGYLKDGFLRVEHLEVPGIGHELPPGDWFEKGIEYLDTMRNHKPIKKR